MEERKTNETVDIRDFKAEARKRKLKECGRKVLGWIQEHPVEALGAATMALGVGKKTLGVHKVKTEERRRATEFYNPRTGMYATTKRPLTAKEKAYAENRFRNGDSWTDIFSDMKLLK